MRWLSSILCLLVILHCSYAPPVTPDKSNEQDSEVKDDLEEYMEYHRYLKEVVQALESDPDFRERLEKADEEDVRSGKIAEQLDFVNHNVRTKLDEIKRRELDRLRHLATKQFELTNNLEQHTGKVATNEHLDHNNPHTFEIEDLKKLIKKTTADLEAADKKRKEEFKEYEMQKKFDEHQKVEGMEEAQKKEYMEKLKQEEEAIKHHKPLHHPGSKQQLEEVWEKQDHMEQQQFDPKAFFMMHDVDGNGVWDADEVKALFIKELDKLYGPGGPNKDLHERAEEMERMREHVFKENDRNRDGLIDFNEFMTETQKAEFNQDEGWKTLEENQIYTQSEYDEYERRRLEEMRYLQQRGLVDAHGQPIPGAQHQIHQALQQYRAYQHQQAYQQQMQQQQFYPPGQAPQGQVPQGQVPNYQQQYQQGQPQYHGQYPQQPQGQFQQPPQGQFQQPPQGQFQQPPQGQFQQPLQGQYQQPPQGQFQQPPQGQFQQPPQGQFQQPPQGQQPQGQQPSQGQTQGQAPPQNNVNQGQVPVQQQQSTTGQVQQGQGQAPQVQGQAQQGAQAPQSQNPPQAQNPPANAQNVGVNH
ncbi:nucleobindin-2-like isoform X1 [Helicoverpa zea]|uniref:nucleobindin-2-like isoform X1 n=1 Tax=Helicoverpa zea TaxID=7113 RepID=UPI001F5AA25F|nr:nucleobindin-2-like isoform X1 [Helicoverpa zea]